MDKNRIILYGGLYNNKDINGILRLFRKSNNIFFDFDTKKNSYVPMNNLIKYLWHNNVTIIFNIMNTISREDYRWVSKDLIELRSAVQKLIVTSQNDLFTCQLKREIDILDNNGIEFAYHQYDGDPSCYYMCDSKSFSMIDKGHAIVDDRKAGIGLQIHRLFNPINEQKNTFVLK